MHRRAHQTVAAFAALAIVAAVAGVASGVVSATTAPPTEPVDTAAVDSAATGTVPDPAECAQGLTLSDDVLTVATGEVAYPPYVIDDDPTTGQGFEAAVAYAVADQLGFDHDHVEWVRTSFDAAIQPGPKEFDFNVQQYSISPDREAVVTFSLPYYTTNQALVAYAGTPAAAATSLADIQALRLGVATGTTSLTFIEDVIQPDSDPQVFNDNAALKAAMDTRQIDGIIVDLPTAIYIAGVELENAAVVGQFPPVDSAPGEDWGLLFEQDNPLAECVDYAILNLRASGELDDITTRWMEQATQVPLLELDG